jgi:hypothetical protein
MRSANVRAAIAREMRSMAEIVDPPPSTTHTETRREHKGPVKTLRFDRPEQD